MPNWTKSDFSTILPNHMAMHVLKFYKSERVNMEKGTFHVVQPNTSQHFVVVCYETWF